MSATARTTTPHLATEAINDVASIAANEAKLAAAEIRQSVNTATGGVSSLATAVAVLIPGVTTLLIAVSYALALIDGVSLLAGFLITGVIVTVIGAILAAKGRNDLRATSLAPTRTAENVRKDAQTVKEAA